MYLSLFYILFEADDEIDDLLSVDYNVSGRPQCTGYHLHSSKGLSEALVYRTEYSTVGRSRSAMTPSCRVVRVGVCL